MEVITKRIEREDQIIDALIKLDQRAFGSSSYSPWTIAAFIDHGHVYALFHLSDEKFERPIGVLVLMPQWDSPKTIYVVGMAIDPDEQNRGYGTKLMSDVLEDLTKQGVTEVTLDVSPLNYNALHLYSAKFGFELQGFHFDEYGSKEDRLYLIKHLPMSQSLIGEEETARKRDRSLSVLTGFKNYNADRLLLVKSAVLCHGLRSNEYSSDLARWFNPWSAKRTGHVGIHINLLGMVLNLPMDQVYANNGIYTNRSPFEILPENKIDPLKGRWLLVDQEAVLAEVNLQPTPSWYKLKTANDIPMPELFLYEGDGNLMGAIPGKCSYQVQGIPCLFCGFSGAEKIIANPDDYGEVVVEAVRENPNITVTLTGGNTATNDHGLRRYLPYVRGIVQSVKMNLSEKLIPKIQIECSPSNNLEDFDEMIDAGVSSFSINLEIFNEVARKKICPGKKAIPRSTYEKAWGFLVDRLGEYHVGSALIYGLESDADTVEGAIYLLDRGVRPNIIPFKPMPGSFLESWPTPDFIGYHRTCTTIAKEMQKVKMDLSLRLGCTTCGACTLEESIYKELAII